MSFSIPVKTVHCFLNEHLGLYCGTTYADVSAAGDYIVVPGRFSTLREDPDLWQGGLRLCDICALSRMADE